MPFVSSSFRSVRSLIVKDLAAMSTDSMRAFWKPKKVSDIGLRALKRLSFAENIKVKTSVGGRFVCSQIVSNSSDTHM